MFSFIVFWSLHGADVIKSAGSLALQTLGCTFKPGLYFFS